MNNSPCCINCYADEPQIGTSNPKCASNGRCACHRQPSEAKHSYPPELESQSCLTANLISHPLEAWEVEFNKVIEKWIDSKEDESIIPTVKSFIRKVALTARTEGQLNAGFDAAKLYQKIADAREEVHQSYNGDAKKWIEAGLAQGREDKFYDGFTLSKDEKHFKAGKQQALKECLEVVEGMKHLEQSNLKNEVKCEYNTALSDLKQQITSLLK